MSYEDVNRKVFYRLDQIEEKKIEKKIDSNRPTQIFNAFPSDLIMPKEKAINHLQRVTNLDEGTIINSVNQLIKDKKLITAYDRKNRLHLRKNPRKKEIKYLFYLHVLLG